MAASRKSGGSNVTLALANVKRRSGGAWVTATIAKRRSGGTWVDIFASAVVDIINQSVSVLSAAPASAEAKFEMTSGGFEYTYSNGGIEDAHDWLLSGASSAYDVKVDVVGDAPSSGSATGTWLNLGTTRTWVWSRGTVGTRSATLTVSVRDASTLTVLDTATVNIYVEVF